MDRSCAIDRWLNQAYKQIEARWIELSAGQDGSPAIGAAPSAQGWLSQVAR